MTRTPPPVASVQTFARDAISSIQQWLTELSVTEWVLLAAAAAALYWVIASSRAMTRLGPIDIVPVEHDKTDDPTALVNARTSFLRERIAVAGLLPPSGVPGGAPTTDVLAAVEASPIPQANWIAALLRLVPWPTPARYSLAATLVEDVPSPVGVRIWLRSNGPVAPLLETLEASTVDRALERVPAAVFARVSNDAVHIFPIWARWEDEARLRLYLDGIEATKAHLDTVAKAAFQRAARGQPSNALVRLRLANLRETRAVMRPFDDLRTVAEAGVLREYLDLAIERRELVEARYRASVLAARVAHDLDLLPVSERLRVRSALRMPAIALQDLGPTLQRLASRELDHALELVQPWFVLLVWHRLRYAVEPKGYDRRRLKRTFQLAKHCQFVRGLPNDNSRRIRLLIAWHTQLVRAAAGRPTAGWQAYYGACSFFALLLARNDT
jgi:hypothetical protein